MKHNWPVTLLLIALFFAAQLIGMGVLSRYIDLQKSAESGKVEWKDLPAVAGYSMERPDIAPSLSIVYIMVALIIGTVLILLIIRWQKVMLWKIWFWLAVLLCLHIAFSAFMASGVAFVLALVLASVKIFKPNVIVHNITELFIYSGLAVIFVPLLTPLTCIVLLLLISLYDMYAVWHSSHMATMAKFQTGSGIFAGLLLPYSPKNIRMGHKPAKTGKQVRTAILGGGDIGFPMIFAGVVMKTVGLQHALLIPVCATLALFGLLWYSQKQKFYPAMPFLTAGCLIGYGLLFLV